MSIKMQDVEFLEDAEGVPFFRVLHGKYAGLSIRLGAVSFPEDEEGTMRFQYDVIDGSYEGSVIDLQQSVGDLIVEIILKKKDTPGELAYYGGT